MDENSTLTSRTGTLFLHINIAHSQALLSALGLKHFAHKYFTGMYYCSCVPLPTNMC